MQLNDYQFYRTPRCLAWKAWSLFQNREFIRVLDACAGEGDLVEAGPAFTERHTSRRTIDCVEIDISRHPTLREKGLNVVGLDFLQFGSGAIYSHIIMNPPFANGDDHVLKAWDILWNGEIVGIINAETVRNPFSKERQRLANLIASHGSVEFIEGAFSTPDAERKTDVDVALVYLRKEANLKQDILGSFMDELKADSMSAAGLATGFHESKEIALPHSTIENAVLVFNAAVKASRDAVFAQARAYRYSKMLGGTMAERCGDEVSTKLDSSVEWVMKEMHSRYEKLKDAAWAGILRSSNVTSKLSSHGQKQVESEFETIKMLEFTTMNIYGFLHGLVQNQGQIQIDMACDVFDKITRYHTDNAVFYMGWKSNDKHRTCGMKIKMTRFILPGFASDSWRTTLSWNELRLLSDFDKVFAMLDGKTEASYGLNDLFNNPTRFGSLREGKRESTNYFDVRYYPGTGTIHFFPRDKKLIDRLNRIVGRQRQWLPPKEARVSEAFWLQFDNAEKSDKEVRAEVSKCSPRWWDNPLQQIGHQDDRGDLAKKKMGEAIKTVLITKGIDVDKMLDARDAVSGLLGTAA